jgi:hypothetical protein
MIKQYLPDDFTTLQRPPTRLEATAPAGAQREKLGSDLIPNSAKGVRP